MELTALERVLLLKALEDQRDHKSIVVRGRIGGDYRIRAGLAEITEPHALQAVLRLEDIGLIRLADVQPDSQSYSISETGMALAATFSAEKQGDSFRVPLDNNALLESDCDATRSSCPKGEPS